MKKNQIPGCKLTKPLRSPRNCRSTRTTEGYCQRISTDTPTDEPQASLPWNVPQRLQANNIIFPHQASKSTHPPPSPTLIKWTPLLFVGWVSPIFIHLTIEIICIYSISARNRTVSHSYPTVHRHWSKHLKKYLLEILINSIPFIIDVKNWDIYQSLVNHSSPSASSLPSPRRAPSWADSDIPPLPSSRVGPSSP